MSAQVVNNPSIAACTTVCAGARQVQLYQHGQDSGALFCNNIDKLPATLSHGYQQDGAWRNALFSLAFGRFDGASGGGINTTNTYN